MRVTVQTRGEGDAAEAVVQIGRRAVNARPALTRAAQILAQGERAQFARARASNPQRRPTAERKRRAGYPAIPFRQSGDLESSLTSRGGHGDAIRDVAGDTLRFGSNKHYLKFQKAQLVHANAKTLDDIDDMVAGYLMTGRLV